MDHRLLLLDEEHDTLTQAYDDFAGCHDTHEYTFSQSKFFISFLTYPNLCDKTLLRKHQKLDAEKEAAYIGLHGF